MKVFKNNEFFAGLSIPEPDVRESIESKMPRDFSIDGMDFLKVNTTPSEIVDISVNRNQTKPKLLTR